jgi:hypothetical protein
MLSVMPGLVPGIHVLEVAQPKDVDGRDEPGHDAEPAIEGRNYSAGAFGLVLTNVPLRLSQS